MVLTSAYWRVWHVRCSTVFVNWMNEWIWSCPEKFQSGENTWHEYSHPPPLLSTVALHALPHIHSTVWCSLCWNKSHFIDDTKAQRRIEQLPHGHWALQLKCVPSDSKSRVLGLQRLPGFLKSWVRAMQTSIWKYWSRIAVHPYIENKSNSWGPWSLIKIRLKR